MSKKLAQHTVNEKHDFLCPKCKCHAANSKVIDTTESEFKAEPDPHYYWIETIECRDCKNEFKIYNAS